MAVLTLMLALAMQDAPKPSTTRQTPGTPARVAPRPSRNVQPPPPPMTMMAPPPALPSAVPPRPPVPADQLGRRPAPRGLPQNWVTGADYPPAALRAGQTGIVSFALVIDEAGRVADCAVTGSSGSESLDRTTCSLMRRRARFTPALDLAGNAAPSEWRSRFRWELAEPDLVPILSWAGSLRFTITPAGTISACSTEMFGNPVEPDDDACAQLPALGVARLRQLRGGSKGPVTILIRFDHVVEGTAAPASSPIGARFGEVFSQRRTFGIDEEGKPFDCREARSDPGDSGPGSCLVEFRYVADGKRHGVTTRLAILTDGDRKISHDDDLFLLWGE